MNQSKSTLLVIGGGFAGLTIITQAKGYNIILVDTKKYFEYVPSVFYYFVEPNNFFQQIIHYEQLQKIHKFTFIQGKIESIQDHEAYYEGGTIKFDKCVITTGSLYNFPIKSLTPKVGGRFIEIKRIHEQIKEKQTILIIGGGTVGIEAACEIKCQYQQKDVVLVARNKILSTMPRKCRIIALERMKKIGVEVKESFDGEKVVKYFDIVLECIGNKFESITYGEGLRDKKKQIQVDNYLRVRDQDDVYAAGDIALSSLNEQKTAFSAEMYAELVVNNINNKKKQKQLGWVPNTYIISIGGWKAILVFEEWCFGGILPYLMKWLIERIVINDFKGVIGMHLLHQLMNYSVYFMLHCYMIIQLMFAMIPLTGRIKPRLRDELRQLKAELGK